VGMSTAYGHLTDSELLSVIDAALDDLGDDRLRLANEKEQLDLLKASLRVDARLYAWQARLAARLDAADAAWHEHGTSTATWLADAANLTRREAGRLLAAGQELARFPIIADAASTGAVLPGQANAITSVLDHLPDNLPTEKLNEAQELMVGFAHTHNSTELRTLRAHLLTVIAPDTADELDAARLEREHRQASRDRHLTFKDDHHGSVLIRGSLPVAAAEPLIRLVDSYTSVNRGVDDLDPETEYVTPAMRRADGLLALVHHHQQQALAPTNGGDRPRVVVTLSYDSLLQAATDAGCPTGHLAGSGTPIAASLLRQLLCDADIMPAVLGGPSELLDVGRTRRLVTPAIRAALELRDGGCVFAGCDKPPQACHAHHLIPWWAGGPTALTNLVLLCPHHHGTIEPSHDPTADRWTLHLRPDGVTEILPPLRVDAHQRPRVHARFLTRHRQ